MFTVGSFRTSVRQCLAVSLVLLGFSAPVPAAEKLTFIHTDALGSPVAATDEQGNLVWRKSYTPYGEETQTPPSPTESRGFTGHILDEQTGMLYAGARWIDPAIGRFMSVDPKAYSEGNPLNFNRYAYGNNNPYKFIDPNGEDSFLVSRPLGGNSIFFSHNFIVTNARFIGDPNATVYSYGENSQGNTGRVDEKTKGFSEGTHEADKNYWKRLAVDPRLAHDSVTKIGAPDPTVDRQAISVVENTDYAAIGASFGTGTNSNSAASAVADTAQGSKVAIPGGVRMSPGTRVSGEIRFEQ